MSAEKIIRKIKIKPLSINKAFQGRRFKTSDYKEYEQELLFLLPKIKIPGGKLKLEIEVGYSNKSSDIDNFVKPFVDVLQKRYDFDDKNIYALNLQKTIVAKGEEFINFSIEKNE